MVQIPNSVVFAILSIVLLTNENIWKTVDHYLEVKYKPLEVKKEEPLKLILPNIFGNPPPLMVPPKNENQSKKPEKWPSITSISQCK